MPVWLVTFFAGAKRWFNKEMAFAVIAAVVVFGVILAAALLYGAGQSSGGAKRDVSWLSRANAGLAAVMKKRAADARAQTAAAVKSLEVVEAERDEAIARAAAVAAELAKLQDDPVVYPRKLVQEMNR